MYFSRISREKKQRWDGLIDRCVFYACVGIEEEEEEETEKFEQKTRPFSVSFCSAFS